MTFFASSVGTTYFHSVNLTTWVFKLYLARRYMSFWIVLRKAGISVVTEDNLQVTLPKVSLRMRTYSPFAISLGPISIRIGMPWQRQISHKIVDIPSTHTD